MNIVEKIKNKYSWLTWSLFAELYWYYVVSMILPAALLDSTFLLFLVFLAIIFLMVVTWQDEVRKREIEASQYLDISTDKTPEIEINYKPVIRNAIRDGLKYSTCGLVLYVIGHIIHLLLTELGFFSTTLALFVKIGAVIFVVSLALAHIFWFFLWAIPKIFNWAIAKE